MSIPHSNLRSGQVSSHEGLLIRIFALASLLVLELVTVSLNYDANQSWLADSGLWYAGLSEFGNYAKIAVAVLVFVVLGILPRIPGHLDRLKRTGIGYPFYYSLVAQLGSFAIFVICTDMIFGRGFQADSISPTLVLAWLVSLSAIVGFWFFSLAPISFWRKFVSIESRVLLAAVPVGIMAWLLAAYAQTLWSPLSDLTFWVSASMLDLFYPEIYINAQTKDLGVRDFIVNIAPECSGYEGMGLVLVFTGFYLSVFRKDFHFPQAFLLFPIGVVVIWLFNNLRIVGLISIGASISPEIAVGGFHSQAGWIAFIVVIAITLYIAYRIPYFSARGEISVASAQWLNLPMALLLPFVVLMATTIITSALAADFQWLYPLRVLAVAATLAYCWKTYRFTELNLRLLPWVAGAVVFGIWILLVSGSPEKDTRFSSVLFGESAWIVAGWLLIRWVGAVVTVPIAEELLFRGYLLSRLSRSKIVLEGSLKFSWFAFVASSILFGLLHAEWVAGIAAGLIFGWVRYRCDSIKDAIVAHMFANFLLAAYILLTSQWSLW